MKPLALLLLLCAITAAPGRADDSLVDASKNAKAKRRKSTTKVITNADVKKSKGTLVNSTAAETPLPPPEPGMVEQFEAAKQARVIADAKLLVLQKDVAALEKQLAAIEQSYYEENDLRRRDTEIRRRFDETKTKLDAARAALAQLEPAAEPKQDAQPESQDAPPGNPIKQ